MCFLTSFTCTKWFRYSNCGFSTQVPTSALRVSRQPFENATSEEHMPKSLRPNLYRTIKIVMSDGATFRVPSAVRTVGNTLQLDRDPANHPAYLVRAAASLV